MEAIDLFERYELLPEPVSNLIDKMSEELEDEDQDGYEVLRRYAEKIRELGFVFDFYLDAVPYALCSTKLFNTLHGLYLRKEILTPVGEDDNGSDFSKIFVTVMQGYYTFQTGEVHQITLNELLGK